MSKFYLLFLLPVLLLFSCKSDESSSSKSAVFRYNESKGITSLDPAYARNQTNIWPVSQVFNGLVQLDDSLDVRAAIAKNYSISNKGKTYKFTLRNDVLFHRSQFLTARERIVTSGDFIYSFNRILDSDVASPGAWIFEFVDTVNGFIAPTDTTLIINLKQPFPGFLSILAMPYCSVVPEEIVENPEADFANHPIGTGPFKFKLWSPEEKLILRRNEEYFEYDEDGVQLPYLEAVSITFIKDKQSEFLEFLNGKLDFLSGVHTAYKDELITRSGELNPKYEEKFVLLKTPYLNTEYLGILQEKANGSNSPLLNKKVRLAINYGFDRVKMMKYMRNNLGFPATAGMIPPGLPGHLSENTGYTYQPDLARQLLDESGFLEMNEQEITLTTTSDYLDLCEYIQFELGKIGLKLNIAVSTGGAFRNMVANANLPFFRGSWIADYADAENYMALFYSGNHAPAGPNYTRFSSPEFDSLYESAFSLENAEEREELYREMDRILLAEAPIVPLYYDMVVRFTSKEIHGFLPNPMNNLILKRLKKSN